MRSPALLALTLAFLGISFGLGAEPPLPRVEALFKRVLENAKAVATQGEAFTYLELATERELDSKERVTKTTIKEYEVTRINGRSFKRLMTENGQPLPEAKARKEEARQRKALEEILAPEGPAAPAKGNEISLTVEDLLAMLEVTDPRWETFQGHRLVALDFAPRKDAKPKGLGQRLASKLQGKLLVDDEHAQVVKAEAKVLDSCRVGGGLLGSLFPPTRFTFEQQMVRPGLWMPSGGHFVIHARVVVVPVRKELEFHCRDFRQFEVGQPVLEAQKAAVAN